MKTRILFIAFMLVASCGAGVAQFKMAIGPSLGFNYNFYHGQAISNANRTYGGMGISFGGQADMSFSPVIGMLINLTAYDMMSASSSVTQSGTKSTVDIGLGYLTVDPLLKFTIPNTGLGFFGGPGIGFKLNGTQQAYSVANGQRTQTVDKTDILNTRFRINGQLGMLYSFDLGSVVLSPFFLFDYGFTSVDETDGWQASGIKTGIAIKFSVVK